MRSKLRSVLYATLATAFLSCTDNSITGPDFDMVQSRARAVAAPAVVISQIYGGGGNSGAQYKNDFVELFNPGSSAISLTGWTLQYASATQTTANWTATTLSGSIAAGGYYLVKLASQGFVAPATDTTGASIPIFDRAGTTNISATTGKVLVASQTTAFNVQCPTGATVIDRIGYGTSNCGTAATWIANAPAPSNTTASFRKVSGCTYSGDPSADFATAVPSPRNSASPLNPCNSGAPIDHIAITAPTTVWLTTGGTYTFDVKAFDAANAQVGGVVFGWSSSNNTIATVSSTGLVTVDGVLGSVTITATAGGKTAAATVNVVAVDHVSVSPSVASIAQNATQQFSAAGFDAANNTIFNVPFTWSSADAARATVSATGLATGLLGGTVSITAKTANNVVGTASLTVTAPPPPADIVISQIFGGGGNSGSTILQDYIELYNHGSTPVDLTGWSVQYASNNATAWSPTPLTGTIQPGKYFLVQEAAGASVTAVALSNPDVIGSIGLSGTNGKIILVRGTAAQSGACPNGGIITDRVAYGVIGTSNDCVATWGAQLTSSLTNTTAQWRNNDGCDNTGIVANDFTIMTADPRNALSPAKACTQPPRSQSSATIAINEILSDPVNSQPSSGQWFEVINFGSAAVNLQGWTIISGGSNQPDHTIASSVVVPAGGYAVLGRSTNRTFNGDAPVDYSYFVGTKTIFLDSKDFLMLVDNTNARVDSVAWTSMPHGVSVGVRNVAGDNTDANGANWGFATSTFGQGDFGTPGADNEPLANSPPAVSTNHITVSGRVATDAPLPVGFEAQIFPSLLNQANQVQSGATFTWSSLTPAIATIDPVLGVIHSVSPGTAVFHVVAMDGTQKNHTLVMEAGTLGNAQYGNNTEFGDPIDNTPADEYVVRRPQFTSSYNQFKGRPNWVSYDLNGSQFQSGTDRCNCFTHDPLLPSGFPHLTTADYTGAGSFAAAGRTPPAGWSYGIDRGHMTRSSDRTTGTIDNADTYYLSNVVPQFADLNQGPWNVMEGDLHAMAATGTKEIYIITGPAGINTTTTPNAPGIPGTVKGEGKIEIPASTWKIAVIMSRGQGLANVRSASDVQIIAVNMPNVPGVRNEDWHQWETTVAALEQLTGYDFLSLLPDNIEAVVEGRTRAPTSQPGGPYSAVEGSNVSFNGSASSDPDNDPLTFAWQFGDGSTGSGVTTTHAYADNGSYSAILTATDPAGASDATNTPVTITNAAPVVSAGSSFVANAGQPTTVSASFTDAGINDSPWSYSIAWGDGQTSTGSTNAQGSISGSHTYATSASYSVTFTVTDKDGGVGSNSTSGVVRSAPTAAVNGPFSGSEGSSIAMSGAASSDTDGTVTTYAWNFGDGSAGTGASVSHAYANDGDYTVTLVVTDNDGLSSTATTTSRITNVSPVVAAFDVGRLPAGGTYSAAGSFVDPGADTWTATVDFGDGSGVQPLSLTGKTFTLSHSYAAAGTYTTTVVVSDGTASGSSASAVTVLAAPRAATDGPFTGAEGSSVAMSGSASSDSDGTVASYAWNFGDGTTGTGASVSHVYANDGNYTVTLVVTDNDGLSGTTSTTAAVTNVAPTVAPLATGRFPAGGTYSATGTFTDPGADTWNATVNYGDGSGVQPLTVNGKSFTLSHTYAVAGNFTVTVSVSDGSASGGATASITVLAAPTAAVNGPFSSSEGASVSMSGAGSSDTDGTVASFAWNFGDGSTGTGTSVSHTYSNDGDYTVTLVVTDNDGLTGITTSVAHVTNVAPAIAPAAAVVLASTGNYSATGSFTDPGSDSWTATVNYGDGSPTAALALSGNSFTLSHHFTAGATYTVTITASDDDVTTTSTRSVRVQAEPVSNAGGPYNGNEGSSISMSGSGSTDVDGSIASYAWTFGDGGSASGAAVSHTYANNGDYTVTLVVTDNEGLTGTSTTTVHVNNVAAVISAFPGATLVRGESYSASSSFTDPGADTWSATVNYGDGSGTSALSLAGKNFSLAHTYNTAGTFTVTVTINDGTSASTSTATVVVKTASQGVQDAMDIVNQFVAGGKLSNGNGNSLLAKLSAAQNQIGNGNMNAANNQLQALLNELNSMVSTGKLSTADANTLRAAVNRVIASIS